MMDPVIKEQWCRALESGDYTQGKSQLKYDDSYCCLGVLCDILHISESTDEEGSTTYDGELETLPDSARTISGLDSCNPRVNLGDDDDQEGVDDGIRTVALLNDEGMSFADLATLIRAQL